MPRAIWNGTVVAEAAPDAVEVVEGNVYFPPAAVKHEYLRESATHSICHWKGTASYYDLNIDGQTVKDAGWFYPEPKEAAAEIKDHVAFWKDVIVEKQDMAT